MKKCCSETLVTMLCLLALVFPVSHTFANAFAVYSTQNQDIEALLQEADSQDEKEMLLTDLLSTTKSPELLVNLYCERGNIRVTHTHLPKGVKDLEKCVNGLISLSGEYSQIIAEREAALVFAKRKYAYTTQLLKDPEKPLVTHFTALWKLGKREDAVKLVKEKAIPYTFSTMSTMRLVKAGYLCEGAGPLGPEKSYRTRKGGPYWWCHQLDQKD